MKVSDRLDYKLERVEDRLNHVKKIIADTDEYLVDFMDNRYNPHINQTGLIWENTRVGKDLESIANYLLYAKDSDASDDTITDYRQKRNSNREASIDKLLKVREIRKETNRSIIKVPKIKVNKLDRALYPELRESGQAIKILTNQIKTGVDSKGNKLSQDEIKKLKWIRTDIQKDEIAVKNELKGYIRFQSIMKSEPDYHALSYLQFDDVEIIRILIKYYQEFKYSYDDTFGYLKSILFTFENLVEATEIKGYMKDIFAWKVKDLPYDVMIKKLDEEHGIKMTKPRLSKITRETLPSMIVDTYKQQREDWAYTYILRGKYKACSKCQKNYLAMQKYFSPDKKSKSGFRSVCKECRKLKYKKDTHAKNE
ncbi:hypothetical protein ABE137_12605 [Brevibacillus laterosporus]|uniref:sigma factor n=1 Tax=Brevibacillus phage Sundance TaxID=1691958 RepID=UPI0006BD2F1A|nr:sigma factor [Brevibacillus phage Sundance]ALA47829.1 luxR family protein [Brevibacillus phage Sundance]